MSEDGLRKLGKAKEESYFDKQNREKLEALKKRLEDPLLKSPSTSEEMTRHEINGVVIDFCRDSKGVWLEKQDIDLIAQKPDWIKELKEFIDKN